MERSTEPEANQQDQRAAREHTAVPANLVLRTRDPPNHSLGVCDAFNIQQIGHSHPPDKVVLQSSESDPIHIKTGRQKANS